MQMHAEWPGLAGYQHNTERACRATAAACVKTKIKLPESKPIEQLLWLVS